MPCENYHNNPSYWMGRLAMLTAHIAPTLDQPDKTTARKALDELIASDVPCGQLRDMLTEQMEAKR